MEIITLCTAPVDHTRLMAAFAPIPCRVHQLYEDGPLHKVILEVRKSGTFPVIYPCGPAAVRHWHRFRGQPDRWLEPWGIGIYNFRSASCEGNKKREEKEEKEEKGDEWGKMYSDDDRGAFWVVWSTCHPLRMPPNNGGINLIHRYLDVFNIFHRDWQAYVDQCYMARMYVQHHPHLPRPNVSSRTPLMDLAATVGTQLKVTQRTYWSRCQAIALELALKRLPMWIRTLPWEEDKLYSQWQESRQRWPELIGCHATVSLRYLLDPAFRQHMEQLLGKYPSHQQLLTSPSFCLSLATTPKIFLDLMDRYPLSVFKTTAFVIRIGDQWEKYKFRLVDLEEKLGHEGACKILSNEAHCARFLDEGELPQSMDDTRLTYLSRHLPTHMVHELLCHPDFVILPREEADTLAIHLPHGIEMDHGIAILRFAILGGFTPTMIQRFIQKPWVTWQRLLPILSHLREELHFPADEMARLLKQPALRTELSHIVVEWERSLWPRVGRWVTTMLFGQRAILRMGVDLRWKQLFAPDAPWAEQLPALAQVARRCSDTTFARVLSLGPDKFRKVWEFAQGQPRMLTIVPLLKQWQVHPDDPGLQRGTTTQRYYLHQNESFWVRHIRDEDSAWALVDRMATDYPVAALASSSLLVRAERDYDGTLERYHRWLKPWMVEAGLNDEEKVQTWANCALHVRLERESFRHLLQEFPITTLRYILPFRSAVIWLSDHHGELTTGEATYLLSFLQYDVVVSSWKSIFLQLSPKLWPHRDHPQFEMLLRLVHLDPNQVDWYIAHIDELHPCLVAPVRYTVSDIKTEKRKRTDITELTPPCKNRTTSYNKK